MPSVTVRGGHGYDRDRDDRDNEPTARYVARSISRALMEQCESAYREARRLFHLRGDAETSRMHDDALRAYEDARALYARHEVEE